MPEESSSNLEHALEADMARLAVEVQKHRENPELRRLGGHEIIKQAIRTMAPAPTPSAPQPSSGPLPAYAADASAETKLEIEYLLDMALHHGIEKANAHAQKSSPFILDAFHDALVTKLYPELKKRGIVE